MICDLNVTDASFMLTVATTTELIHDNEIYPSGSNLSWEVDANVIIRNVPVSSHYAAVSKVGEMVVLVTKAVEDHVSPLLNKRSFQLIKAEAIEVEEWEVLLIKSVGAPAPIKIDVVGNIEERGE